MKAINVDGKKLDISNFTKNQKETITAIVNSCKKYKMVSATAIIATLNMKLKTIYADTLEGIQNKTKQMNKKGCFSMNKPIYEDNKYRSTFVIGDNERLNESVKNGFCNLQTV